MPRVSKYHLQKEIHDEIFETLLQTFANLTSKKQVSSFFNEFLTPTERIMLAKRLTAGLLIAEGYSQIEIKHILKMSTSTISGVAILYKYGQGYRSIVDGIRVDKKIKNSLLSLGDVIATIGSIGGKGSRTWREVKRSIKSKKSILTR